MQRLTILNPGVADRAEQASLARELGAVENARVAFVDNSKVNADFFLSCVKSLLEEKFGVRVGTTIRKLAPKDELSEAEVAELSQYDAVIQCFGDCGTSTSMTVADGVRLESRGVPTATVISTAFSGAARHQAAGRGMAGLPIVEIPHPMHSAPKSLVAERAHAVVARMVEALTRRSEVEPQIETRERAPEIVFDEPFENVQEFFFAQGWTDGLPVVPPTHAAVRAMLAAAGKKGDEAIGPVPPRMRQATVEKVAINAVMAGCRPEYFPVVLAALDAALDPQCRLYGIRTATNNGTPLVIVNGPIAKHLHLNSKGNVFGQGWRANATIGRALQLILRNIGGDAPGETDMSTQGQPGKFTFCIAENEDESPWTPFHVERGYRADESAVTVIGASAGHNMFTYGCETGAELLDHFVGAMTALGHNNVIFPTGPLLVLGPEHAGVLARDGYDKQSIREYVFEHARIPLSRFPERTVRGLKHRRSRWFAEVNDPHRIGVADHPSHINIVVAGGAGIHSQFVPTSFSLGPVTRRIEQ